MSQDPFNPYQPPEASQLEPALPVGQGDEALPPLPWEDKDRFPGFWKRVGEMFGLVFSDPLGYFARVPHGEGFFRPWLFQLLLLTPLLLLMGFVFLIVGMAGFAAAGAAKAPGGPPAWLFTAILPLMVVFFPLFIFLGMVIWGSLIHLSLWMWGGLKQGQPLGQSIRAFGYGYAFVSLGSMIPYLGILVMLGGLVWIGMGIARMHRTDTWRGIVASFTPFVLCCCAYVAFLMTVLTTAGIFGRH